MPAAIKNKRVTYTNATNIYPIIDEKRIAYRAYFIF